ncbi:phosphopantothenoylcysteine decarboxylase/phosphopantothenate--cysteine ligase [Scopulibacillus daqui]|uniref:Coenzyme A biosynthesis bifunctional protein CoaBC n=1 Tax=Scopulibacillus daqui TaxID=1469162 RepID=A0ABS2PWJ4_9BACL|nr:bifunctional phosphopantothenoylcysteine decarboxylase/phosphopantothenate--cysteine ligase CoaBC [Scopulibacillus daqui]MBM7644306.1 phosphopantothenoylcysteine decarboxylase/phosphopantothenate--cysteine ligase [Scopulibacillus daqui]
MSIKNKCILLCVTGGIAAYKTAILTSMLKKAGADVRILMSRSAKHFIGASTFQGLSREPVYDDIFIEHQADQIAHIDLADRADLVIVAPATANIIGKMANGIADDMITTTILATKAPVWVAPAMNVNMYQHPAVTQNIERLKSIGYKMIEPGEGLLACGWVGQGRLAEPEAIYQMIAAYFNQNQGPLKGKNILVTAGPTRESIDPVRYFSNYSSGKMGYAIAQALRDKGADVTLISGPAQLTPPDDVEVVYIESTLEMYEEVMKRYPKADAVVKSAAVSDYRPKHTSQHKVKKSEGPVTIEMVRNPDILKELGEKKEQQILIGFAAETRDVADYAKKKLENKNLDMIVANNVLEADAGFQSDTNRVTFFYRHGKTESFELLSKNVVANHLADALISLFEEREQHDC